MGTGQTGVGGRPAANPVERVSRNVLEAAPDQRRNLVETNAREKHRKFMSAAIIHAQVRPGGPLKDTDNLHVLQQMDLIQVLYICCTSEVSLCTYTYKTAHSNLARILTDGA